MAYYDVIETPLGRLFVGGSAEGLHRIDFIDERHDESALRTKLEAEAGEPAKRDPVAARQAVEALQGYFAGDDFDFDLPLVPRGTDFQRAVWDAELNVAPGDTVSYGEIARAVGRPGAARAVGAATGRNPLSIVVPCHRIVGADGSLTGYGGGLDRKRWLLDHEARTTVEAARR